MRTDLFLYLSGPITATATHSVEEHCATAAKWYFQCLRWGLPAFCPHLSGMFPTAHSFVEYEQWMAYDQAVIRRCTHLVLLPRWEASNGARRERMFAEGLGLPILAAEDLKSHFAQEITCALT